MTNDAAAEMGRLRWKGKTAEERAEHARLMNEARWGKDKPAKAKKRAPKKRQKHETPGNSPK